MGAQIRTESLSRRRLLLAGTGLGAATLLAGCATNSSAAPSVSAPSEPAAAPDAAAVLDGLALTVAKSPTCGCCGLWVDHLTARGVDVTVEHPSDLDAVFAAQNIAEAERSCHIATTAAADVFVGHLPATFIAAYLADPIPGSIGLAVPGMPTGTPGMESGDAFQPYDVLLIADDGSTTIHQSVATAAEQGL